MFILLMKPNSLIEKKKKTFATKIFCGFYFLGWHDKFFNEIEIRLEYNFSVAYAFFDFS